MDHDLPNPPPISLRLLRTVQELEEAIGRALQPLLLIVKASWCARCPEFSREVSTLATQYQFEYCYTDAADTEMTEHYNITKLPAFVLVSTNADPPLVKSPALPTEVRAAVEAACRPALQLDADF